MTACQWRWQSCSCVGPSSYPCVQSRLHPLHAVRRATFGLVRHPCGRHHPTGADDGFAAPEHFSTRFGQQAPVHVSSAGRGSTLRCRACRAGSPLLGCQCVRGIFVYQMRCNICFVAPPHAMLFAAWPKLTAACKRAACHLGLLHPAAELTMSKAPASCSIRPRRRCPFRWACLPI